MSWTALVTINALASFNAAPGVSSGTRTLPETALWELRVKSQHLNQ
jgi:hypothetical protein